MSAQDATILAAYDLATELNKTLDSTVDAMAVLQTIFSKIITTLTFVSNYVTDAPITSPKIALLLLEELWQDLLDAASNYQTKKPNQNRLLLLFSDDNITYIM